MHRLQLEKDSPYESVQVIGLGFVGLTFAAFMCRSMPVIGVEINQKIREQILVGNAHFYETGLDAAIRSGVDSGMLKVSDSPLRSEKRTAYVLTLGTPIFEKKVNLSALESVASQIVRVAKPHDLVIVRSTVELGTTRDLVLAKFQEARLDVYVAMCPERTIEGKALIELQSLPQIIGGVDQASTYEATRFFHQFNIETVDVESSEAAELAKLANNTYRDLQFAFANEIAILGDVMGVNARKVIEAANFNYSRSNIPAPGLTAGPCLEKDPWILANSAEKLGVDMPITKSSRLINELSPIITIHRFFESEPSLKFSKNILVAGLAFKGKPETSDTRGSLAFPIIDQLRDLAPNSRIFTLDPMVDKSALPQSLRESHYRDLENFEPNFDLIVVQHNSDQLVAILKSNWDNMRNSFVLDFWNCLELSELDAVNSYEDKPKRQVFGGARSLNA